MNEILYDDRILLHFHKPYHRGRMQNPTIVLEDENPLCGDRVHLELLVDDNRLIREAWFDGQGCAISLAAASILVHHVEGHLVPGLNAFQASQMFQLLGVPLTTSRQQCGLLAFKILQTMLRTLEGHMPADK